MNHSKAGPTRIYLLMNLDIPMEIISSGEGPEEELNASHVGIHLEGNMVMDGISGVSLAMCLLFGLTYRSTLLT